MQRLQTVVLDSNDETQRVIPMKSDSISSIIVSTPTALLLHVIGSQAVWSDWQGVLAPLGKMQIAQQDDRATWQGQGFMLQLQLLDEPLHDNGIGFDAWGLHSVTLMAQARENGVAWPHDWPLGLQAQDLAKLSVSQCLGQALVSTKAFSIHECEVSSQEASRSIGVKCEWQGQQLARLTLLRMGAFEPLQPFEFAPAQLATAPVVSQAPVQRSQPEPEITCRSEERTPKTGLYEAHVLRSHPNAHYYNTSRNRFYFSQEGKPMIRLGVPEGGESLVTWTWRSASN